MKRIKNIVISPFPISDPDDLWIDSSNPNSPIVKYMGNEGWEVLVEGGSGVPYVGATEALDLGENPIKANSILLDVNADPTGRETGESVWDSIEGTISTTLKNSVTLQNGMEVYFYAKAIGAIANGDVVQLAGAGGIQGDHLIVKSAVQSEIKATPLKLLGIATQAIANGDFGYITYIGKVHNVYTTGFAAGDSLYYDILGATPGAVTNVEPESPNTAIRLGSVLKLATGASENGTIGIRIQFGAPPIKTFTITPILLPQEDWTLSEGNYQLEYSDVRIKSSHFVDVIPAIGSTDIIKTAEIYPYVETATGIIRMFSKNAPTGDITVTFNVYE